MFHTFSMISGGCLYRRLLHNLQLLCWRHTTNSNVVYLILPFFKVSCCLSDAFITYFFFAVQFWFNQFEYTEQLQKHACITSHCITSGATAWIIKKHVLRPIYMFTKMELQWTHSLCSFRTMNKYKWSTNFFFFFFFCLNNRFTVDSEFSPEQLTIDFFFQLLMISQCKRTLLTYYLNFHSFIIVQQINILKIIVFLPKNISIHLKDQQIKNYQKVCMCSTLQNNNIYERTTKCRPLQSHAFIGLHTFRRSGLGYNEQSCGVKKRSSTFMKSALCVFFA